MKYSYKINNKLFLLIIFYLTLSFSLSISSSSSNEERNDSYSLTKISQKGKTCHYNIKLNKIKLYNKKLILKEFKKSLKFNCTLINYKYIQSNSPSSNTSTSSSSPSSSPSSKTPAPSFRYKLNDKYNTGAIVLTIKNLEEDLQKYLSGILTKFLYSIQFNYYFYIYFGNLITSLFDKNSYSNSPDYFKIIAMNRVLNEGHPYLLYTDLETIISIRNLVKIELFLQKDVNLQTQLELNSAALVLKNSNWTLQFLLNWWNNNIRNYQNTLSYYFTLLFELNHLYHNHNLLCLFIIIKNYQKFKIS